MYGDDKDLALIPETLHGDDTLDGGKGLDILYGNGGEKYLKYLGTGV